MTQTKYRPDIDGLRALAIAPVVWFHSGLPGLPGGFTGVDTFFVISGFLISGIIHREVTEGTFSFGNFYERRVRRIAPALLTVLIVTLLVGFALLLPDELIKLGRSAIAALLMFPNIHFWQEAGYFQLGEEITPLLHTWSLGVEEQFYVFFPLLLIFAHRLRLVKPVLVVATAASFAFCVVGTMMAPSASFYLLPTRAWELLLGSLLAVGVFSIRPELRPATSIAGLLLLVVAAVTIGEGARFPGWVATIPAVGALLLIASGPDAPANRLLALRPFVGIGKISYSLYLWHWPVFVFFRHYRADPDLPFTWAVAGILLSAGLAWITYRFVEQPARHKTFSYRRVAELASAGGVAVIATAIVIVTQAGMPARFSPQVIALASQKDDVPPLAVRCTDAPLDRINDDCRIGRGHPQVLVWGDSHAAAASQGVADGLEKPALVASTGACAPALGWHHQSMGGADAQACAERNAEILRRVMADPAIETVVLAAYWPHYERAGGKELWHGTQALISRLTGKNVIVLAGTPEPGFNVPWASAIRARWERPQTTWSCQKMAVPLADAEIADLSEAYCAYPQPLRLFTDGNHPSLTANTRIITPALHQRARVARLPTCEYSPRPPTSSQYVAAGKREIHCSYILG